MKSGPQRYFDIQVVSGILVLLIIVTNSCSDITQEKCSNQEIWFNYPAKYWNSQALHLGNGYFGASFYGGVEEEVFSLTEASMWTGEPAMGRWEKAGVNPNAMESLSFIREAVVQGKADLADSLISSDIFGSSELYGHFTSIGDVKIRFTHPESSHSEYRRSLDLENSLGSVQYKLDGITFGREYFCSYPDRVLAMRFTASEPGSISFNLGMEIMQDSSTVEISGNSYRLSGFINGNLRPFQVLIEVRNRGGVVGAMNDALTVDGADEVEIYMTTATNYSMSYPDYTGEDPSLTTHSIIQEVLGHDFDHLKNRHVVDYRSLYDRVTFSIEGEKAVEHLPTNDRFERLKLGISDPGYKVLAFNLGRYMIISSSRPGTLPANLQGVWNAFYVAPWAGNYQSNINLQEIYWSCGPTDLAECQQSYIDWIEDLAISGREIARRVYGTDGWVSHTTGNIWGHAAPIGNHPWGMYPMAAAWHCQHVWDQYLFTTDLNYLKSQAYPLMKDAARFWLQNLIPYKGYLITAPSVSAEHGALQTESGLNPAFHDLQSDQYRYSLPGIYQDIQMIWELFSNTADAAGIVKDSAFAGTLIQTREKLLPLKIGKHAQLQEWFQDIDDPGSHHRHIAHLYAVCPGTRIHPTITPELADAAKKSLDMRGDGRFPEQEMASGGNWARAHRMWCWTRLLDGNRALKIMNEMLTEQGFENGLTYQHAPYHMGRDDFYMDGDLYCHFQLDGSASIPGCIAEMLVQSHQEEIHLLPALPDEFDKGKITGVRARGGYRIDLEWENGSLTSAVIKGPSDAEVPVIRLKDKVISPDDHPEIHMVKD